MRRMNDPINDAAVVAIHPGGDGFRPAPALPLAERLASAERRIIDAAIERHIHGSGEIADLAVAIVAMRAEIPA